MSRSPDFSELIEAADLMAGLLGRSAPERAGAHGQPPPSGVPRTEAESIVKTALPAQERAKPVAVSEGAAQGSAYRGDRLDQALEMMCRRGGFSGAVVADDDALLLAAFNSPVEAERAAAFTSVLGASLERAGQLLGEKRANNISLDIGYADKAVLRHFLVADRSYYLLLICPQEIDHRAEVELSIERLAGLLAQPAG